nr:hypothetical protein [Abyssibacter sp.]
MGRFGDKRAGYRERFVRGMADETRLDDGAPLTDRMRWGFK